MFAGPLASVGGSISKDVVSPFEAYFGQVELTRGLLIFLFKPGHLEETHTLFPLHKFCEILSLLSQERRSSVQVSSNYCEDSPWSIVENFEGPSSHCNINKRSNLLVGAWDFSHGILSPHLEGGFSWVDWHLHGLSFHTSFTYMHALIGN